MTEQNKVLARVNDREITQEDLLFFMKELNPQVLQHFPGKEGQKRIIEELVHQELLYKEALDLGLDQDPTFVETLEQTKESMLKSFAFARVLEGIDATEEEARAVFETHKESFAEQPTVEAAHILVSEKEEADNILDELAAGKDFAELARERSTCPSKDVGGNLGAFGRGMMVPEFEEAAFALEEGELTKEPVKTQFGYHIIKLLKKRGGTDPTFEEVKDKALLEARRIKQQEHYNHHMAKLLEENQVEYFLD